MSENISNQLNKIIENQEKIIALLEEKSNSNVYTMDIRDMPFPPYLFSADQTTGNTPIVETGVKYSGEPLPRYGVDYLLKEYV
jgi:hypothetical protein